MSSTEHGQGQIPDISIRLNIAAYTFIVIGPLFIFVRCWALHYLENKARVNGRGEGETKIHADSWCLIATVPCILAITVFLILGTRSGFGRHVSDILMLPNGLQRLENAMFFFYLGQIDYAAILALNKIAILHFYIRTFSAFGWFKWLCKILIWFFALISTASGTVDILQCNTIPLAWKGALEQRQNHCINFEPYWYFRVIFSALTDAMIALLPTLVIFRLKMNLRKKLWVSFMFSLGLLVVAVATVRATTIKAASFRVDPTWEAVDFCVYSVLEAGLGIIVACLPPIPKALAMRFPAIKEWVFKWSGTQQPASSSSGNSRAALNDEQNASAWTEFPSFRYGCREEDEVV